MSPIWYGIWLSTSHQQLASTARYWWGFGDTCCVKASSRKGLREIKVIISRGIPLIKFRHKLKRVRTFLAEKVEPLTSSAFSLICRLISQFVGAPCIRKNRRGGRFSTRSSTCKVILVRLEKISMSRDTNQDVVAIWAEATQRGAEPDERRGEGHLGGRAPVQVRELLHEEPEGLLGRVRGAVVEDRSQQRAEAPFSRTFFASVKLENH